MTAKLTPMPGKACLHYVRGRCLHEERLNPGLNRQWLCRIMLKWENEFDRFIVQADNFRLDEAKAAAIWEERLRKMMLAGPPCEDYRPALENDRDAVLRPEAGENQGPFDPDDPDAEERSGEEDDEEAVFACAHAYKAFCLLALPECRGICRHFATSRK